MTLSVQSQNANSFDCSDKSLKACYFTNFTKSPLNQLRKKFSVPICSNSKENSEDIFSRIPSNNLGELEKTFL
jgi:hypothetical protein